MRDITIIFLILITIFVGDYAINNFLGRTTDKLIKNLASLKEHVIVANETENRDNIKNEMGEMEESWKEISEIWAVIVMHQEIDNIEQALIKTKSIINDGNIEDAIPEIETAIFFVEHVKQREKLMLKNIF